MTEEPKNAFLRRFAAKFISPEEDRNWKRVASSGGYDYLECKKTFAWMG